MLPSSSDPGRLHRSPELNALILGTGVDEDPTLALLSSNKVVLFPSSSQCLLSEFIPEDSLESVAFGLGLEGWTRANLTSFFPTRNTVAIQRRWSSQRGCSARAALPLRAWKRRGQARSQTPARLF